MNNRQDYVTSSLELHLFFARIMKEHSLFLKAGFASCNANEAREAEGFLRHFEKLLSDAVMLSNRIVCCRVLKSGEVFTPFTDCAEKQTQRLTGIFINRGLTARTMQLQGRDPHEEPCVTQELHDRVQQLNQNALSMVNRLIAFKEQILHKVENGCLFTGNYPMMLEHILREARLYRAHLLRLEGKDDFESKELRDSECFWNRIMMEHALFIRGLLDPSEEELIATSNDFAGEFKCLLETSIAANAKLACGCNGNPLELVQKFRDFKRSGVEGIENCKIRSLILPLLADHVLREANHYIRLLEG